MSSLSISPALPGAPVAVDPSTQVLQPGTVIDAQVIKQLADNAVRIAIAGLVLDVISEVPLQAGQALTLAVSQAEQGGIRLAIVDPAAGDAVAPLASDAVERAPVQTAAATATARAVADTLSPPPIARNVAVDATPPPDGRAPATPDPVETLQAQALSLAAQAAAPRQRGLAPLFANLAAAVATNRLPAEAQAAAVRLLTLRPVLDDGVSPTSIRRAVAQSGLFLEASLKTAAPTPQAGLPDLKASLLVLRQTLSALVGRSPQGEGASPSETPAPDAATAPASTGASARIVRGDPPSALALQLVPDEIEASATAGLPRGTAALPARPSELARAEVPPPPFRGATPSAQAIVAPSIVPEAPVATTLRHLLDDADGAIARQTLLQAASLPDRTDAANGRAETTTARWALEIPFATPQGTAVAQFEIARDGGGGQDTERAAQVWRARFSLDIEPAGPVHALIAFAGARTSVQMWAERPRTAAQLRDNAGELSRALTNAQLEAGEIVVREGAPAATAGARAGHFLDRAS